GHDGRVGRGGADGGLRNGQSAAARGGLRDADHLGAVGGVLRQQYAAADLGTAAVAGGGGAAVSPFGAGAWLGRGRAGAGVDRGAAGGRAVGRAATRELGAQLTQLRSAAEAETNSGVWVRRGSVSV